MCATGATAFSVASVNPDGVERAAPFLEEVCEAAVAASMRFREHSDPLMAAVAAMDVDESAVPDQAGDAGATGPTALQRRIDEMLAPMVHDLHGSPAKPRQAKPRKRRLPSRPAVQKARANKKHKTRAADVPHSHLHYSGEYPSAARYMDTHPVLVPSKEFLPLERNLLNWLYEYVGREGVGSNCNVNRRVYSLWQRMVAWSAVTDKPAYRGYIRVKTQERLVEKRRQMMTFRRALDSGLLRRRTVTDVLQGGASLADAASTR